ncbi:MAG: hypothetical protein QG656_1196, partial [Candidatus Hydrogenedentes bacterium]|nr:hypothetical protein [Candidatus Hydrogenedentota bacterium]
PAHTRLAARLYFDNYGAGPYWGMRGIPVYGPLSLGGPMTMSFAINPAAVTEFQFYLLRLEEDCPLIVDDACAFTHDSPLNRLVPHPFIDRFGQYIHADWPGKVKDEAMLTAQREEEAQRLAAAPALPGRDTYGGWADGPQLEATGWFRTEQVDGRWWLVTPEGHVFFSIGVDTAGTALPTFVEGRDDWFADLPDPEGPLKGHYGRTDGTHSMAEPIGGKGRNFNFYTANVERKYGAGGEDLWRETLYKRLAAWGFNTLGKWARDDVRRDSPIPFVVTAGSASGSRIQGGGGFWGQMIDVFDPQFESMTDQSIASAAAPYAGNPKCIGYFVDNEMSWEGIATGTLNSPPDQACRQVFVADLQAKYGTIGALNAAWDTEGADWDSLRPKLPPTPQAVEDCAAFEYKFARRYFDTVAAALNRHAPNQLYLGCRFATNPHPAHILRACADVVDVVSINYYGTSIRSSAWTGANDLGKPIVVGEFHFGALDSGMFHQGLQSADSQADRGAKYAEYIRSAAECPAFVGCHWFQWADEATTGRSMDGENFNIGLVSGTDYPHYETLDGMMKANADVYTMRSTAKPL